MKNDTKAMMKKIKAMRNGKTVNGDILLYFDLQPFLTEKEELEYTANLDWKRGPNTWTYFLKSH